MPEAGIVVVGAGPVGATFALLAAARGLPVTLIDAREGASTETRSLALSHGSRIVLARAGAWDGLVSPAEIHTIHTSQQGGFGRVRLSREDAQVPALGYVVGYAALQAALDAALATAGVKVTFGARVSAIRSDGVEYTMGTAGGATQFAGAEAVVLADGGANLDKLADVRVDEKDYGQSAMLATLACDRAHRHTAYERFTPEGPLALLPDHNESTYSMVWVASHARIQTLMAQGEDDVRQQFQTHFGTRAGRFVSLAHRRAYPLRLRQTNTRVSGSTVIIGNAAQAMHPVAGQGFNLGLRDAETLAGLLGQQPVEAALKAYSQIREQDVTRGVGFTDLLASVFLPDVATLRVPRGLALAAVDMLPFARRMLAQRMLYGARG